MQWLSSVENDGPELQIYDLCATIRDKDGDDHLIIFYAKVMSWDSDKPYLRDIYRVADYYFKSNDVVVTDGGLRIPMCNIKNIKYKEINQRSHQPTVNIKGVKDWQGSDWVLFFFGIFLVGLGLAFLALMVFVIIHGKG